MAGASCTACSSAKARFHGPRAVRRQKPRLHGVMVSVVERHNYRMINKNDAGIACLRTAGSVGATVVRLHRKINTYKKNVHLLVAPALCRTCPTAFRSCCSCCPVLLVWRRRTSHSPFARFVAFRVASARCVGSVFGCGPAGNAARRAQSRSTP
jgi:hypothetical protein